MNSKQSPHKPDHKNEPIKAFKRGSVLAPAIKNPFVKMQASSPTNKKSPAKITNLIAIQDAMRRKTVVGTDNNLMNLIKKAQIKYNPDRFSTGCISEESEEEYLSPSEGILKVFWKTTIKIENGNIKE